MAENTGNAAAMLKRLRARKDNGAVASDQPIGSDQDEQLFPSEADQQLAQGDNDEGMATHEPSDLTAQDFAEIASEDQPVRSDEQPTSDLIAQINDGTSADGDAANAAPVIEVAAEAQSDPVVQRMLAQLAKIKAQTQAVTARIEKRATKVVAKATKASTPRAKKEKAAARQPETVAEMFPRFPTLAAVWAKIEEGIAGQEVAEGAFPTVQLSINQTAKALEATRPTVKNAVHALKTKGILVDTTPDLNAAHTYEVHAPDFTEAIKANAALPAAPAEAIPAADEVEQHETGSES